jgi:hypothetical protein
LVGFPRKSYVRYKWYSSRMPVSDAITLLFCIALGFACNTHLTYCTYTYWSWSVTVGFLLTEYLPTYYCLFDNTPHIMVFVELAAMWRGVSMKETHVYCGESFFVNLK